MIRKPPASWERGPSAGVRTAQAAVKVASGSVKVARSGAHVVRGLLCFCFAILWGFAAIVGGLLAHSLPTLIGVGAMAAFMAWSGLRAFAKARDV